MTLFDHLNSPKFDSTQNRSDGKIIRFRQTQALTSHFESFWSIVICTLMKASVFRPFLGLFLHFYSEWPPSAVFLN